VPQAKQLFAYKDSGAELPINLIYDNRQQTTQQNQALDANIEQNKNVADSVKQQYASLESQYASRFRFVQHKTFNLQRRARTVQLSGRLLEWKRRRAVERIHETLAAERCSDCAADRA